MLSRCEKDLLVIVDGFSDDLLVVVDRYGEDFLVFVYEDDLLVNGCCGLLVVVIGCGGGSFGTSGDGLLMVDGHEDGVLVVSVNRYENELLVVDRSREDLLFIDKY